MRRQEHGRGAAAAGSPGITRRAVLEAGIAAGAGLLISARIALAAGAADSAGAPAATSINAWVRIGADNSITLISSQSEMGQGTSTTLTAALADELGVDWTRVKIEFAPFGDAYRFPEYKWMFTGNSESISTFYDLVRRMGAAAREVLVAAAASRLGVAPGELRVADGIIRHAASRRSLSFAEVAADAAQLPVPTAPRLKADGELRYIGRALPRWDIPAKVDGSAVFGIDVNVPGMLLAAVRCSPGFGGRVARYDAAAIRAKPGVVAVVEVPCGLAVVAQTYWQARRALDAADIAWVGDNAELSSASIWATYRQKLESGPFVAKKSTGDAAAALAGAAQKLEAVYQMPFQAHATMEPMNCTAHVTADRCDIWAPTQGVEVTQGVAAQVTGLASDRINVHRTLLGGGFGRRLLADFVKQALIVAKAVGRPVKLIWSREEDMTHDAYRPAMLHRISGALDGKGAVTALAHRVVSPTYFLYVFPRNAQIADWSAPFPPPTQYDGMAVEGLVDPPYALANLLVEQHYLQSDVPVSVWRTTGHGPNNFVLESFVDELAAAARQEPLAFRRALLAGNERMLALLGLAAEKAGWGAPLPSGAGRGVAIAQAFGSLIAQVAEVAVKDTEVKIRRIVTAVDCGKVLDPGIAAANIAGGIVWGLSALRTEVTVAKGRVVENNFDTFDPLHLWETPAIETYFREGGGKLGGLGEIGPVPTHAAVCNAIAAVTGKRIRTLPLANSGFILT
jgi:isoquinoline 1-oxidoreductase beta subunit